MEDNDLILSKLNKAERLPNWRPAQRVTLRFLRGCYFWIKGERDVAIEIWARSEYPPKPSGFAMDFKVRGPTKVFCSQT